MTIDDSDRELLSAMGVGDLDALEALHARYGGAALALALRITGNRETAEEVVQTAFLSAWRGAATYQSERGSARSWLLGIIHHRAIDVVRARSQHTPTVPLLEEEFGLVALDDVWATVQQTLDRAAIRQAMAVLPEKQRQSIDLAYFGGLTYREIASQLDVPLGTIKSRLRLGLEKLRVLLAEPNLAKPAASGAAGAPVPPSLSEEARGTGSS